MRMFCHVPACRLPALSNVTYFHDFCIFKTGKFQKYLEITTSIF